MEKISKLIVDFIQFKKKEKMNWMNLVFIFKLNLIEFILVCDWYIGCGWGGFSLFVK